LALFRFEFDALSHQSHHEIAKKFIQFSEVLDGVSERRQKLGKTMASRHSRRTEAEFRSAAAFRVKGQVL
jgi:hypothetical protein